MLFEDDIRYEMENDHYDIDENDSYDDYDDDDWDDDDEYYDDSMDGDWDSGMRDAGWGTDEDYGYYGENDWG